MFEQDLHRTELHCANPIPAVAGESEEVQQRCKQLYSILQVFFEENHFDFCDRFQSAMALRFGGSWFSCTCPRPSPELYRCCQPS